MVSEIKNVHNVFFLNVRIKRLKPKNFFLCLWKKKKKEMVQSTET